MGTDEKNELKEAHADCLIETPMELVGAVKQLLPI